MKNTNQLISLVTITIVVAAGFILVGDADACAACRMLPVEPEKSLPATISLEASSMFGDVKNLFAQQKAIFALLLELAFNR